MVRSSFQSERSPLLIFSLQVFMGMSMAPTPLERSMKTHRNWSGRLVKVWTQLSKYANQELSSVTLERPCVYPLRWISSRLSCSASVTSEPIARANGCAVVRSYTGHGIHELFHGLPNIPHYAKNKAVGTMKAGMVSLPLSAVISWIMMIRDKVFTIEPVRGVLCISYFRWLTLLFARCSTSEQIGQKFIGQIIGRLLPSTGNVAHNLRKLYCMLLSRSFPSFIDWSGLRSITETGVEVITAAPAAP